MSNTTAEQQTEQTQAPSEAADVPTKPRHRAQKTNRPQRSKKATKPANSQKGAKTAPGGTRSGSKAEAVIALLRRAKGTTLDDMIRATGWQSHTVRGFLSATVGKKLGLS